MNEVVVITKNCPYLSRSQLGRELDYSLNGIRHVMKGFEDEVGRRYSKYAIAGHRYNYYAVIDYLKYKSLLKDEETRKYVPDFNPVEIAQLCGRDVCYLKDL